MHTTTCAAVGFLLAQRSETILQCPHTEQTELVGMQSHQLLPHLVWRNLAVLFHVAARVEGGDGVVVRFDVGGAVGLPAFGATRPPLHSGREREVPQLGEVSALVLDRGVRHKHIRGRARHQVTPAWRYLWRSCWRPRVTKVALPHKVLKVALAQDLGAGGGKD